MDSSLADLITRCESSRINAEIYRQRPDVNWREQVMGGGEEVFRDLARAYASGRVAASTRGTYQEASLLWAKWRLTILHAIVIWPLTSHPYKAGTEHAEFSPYRRSREGRGKEYGGIKSTEI